MSEYQRRIVYLSEAQKNTLFATGSVTVDGKTVTYSDSDLYVTPTSENLSIGVVEAISPELPPYASITGTPENMLLNLGIPVSTQNAIQYITSDTQDKDLNNMIETNVSYVCNNSSTTLTLVNCPVNTTFKMNVEKIIDDTNLIQTVISTSRNVTIYKRVLNGDHTDSNAWGSWTLISNT